MERLSWGFNGTLWDSILQAVNTPGTSPRVESLSARLERAVSGHMRTEQESIDQYEALCDSTTDPVVKALVREVLADEEHHHEMLHRFQNQLLNELDPAMGEAGPSAPATKHDDQTIAAVEAMIEHEQESAKRFNDLAKESEEGDSGLFAALLEAMAADSKKHEQILRFVLKRVKGEDS